MKQRTISLLIAFVFLFPVYPVSAATEKTAYTFQLVNRLHTNADLVVDATVTKVTPGSGGDEPDVCQVQLRYVSDMKLAYADIPLGFNVFTPKGVMKIGDPMLLFLRYDPTQKRLVRALNEDGMDSVVYKAADYQFVRPYLSEKLSREALKFRKDASRYPDIAPIAAAYAALHPDAVAGVYFDNAAYQHMILLSQNANEADARYYFTAKSKSSPYYRIASQNAPTLADLLFAADEVMIDAMRKLADEQPEQMDRISPFAWDIDETNKKIVVTMETLTEEKKAVFKQWIFDCAWIVFEEGELDRPI